MGMQFRELATEISEEKEVKAKEDIPRENPKFLEIEIEWQRSNWILDQNVYKHNKSSHA